VSNSLEVGSIPVNFRRGWSAAPRLAAAATLLLAALFLPRPSLAQSPLTLTGTVGPRQVSTIGTLTWTASASGGDPATTRYAYFRRRPGGTWIPDINAPTWQTSSSYGWNPTASDVGVWETYIWVKDANTPANANTYGYAAGYNTMPIEVFGPPSAPGATTVSCAWSAAEECWVTGGFTASAAAATGGIGSLSYQICRSVDSAGGFAGCDVNLTLSGGTSIAVAGTDLPADGYRRAYYFRARDEAGAYGAWNTAAYVRVDRYPPTLGASNASNVWFSSRTATLSASDTGSGLAALRYSWNTALDAGCTTGSSTSSEATLTAPAGDNLLYLCARDNTGRVGQWSGQYRVSPMGLTGTVSPSRGSYLGSFTWTASASGGTPATTRYAFFRRRPGGTWIPDVNAPTWQAGNTYSWTPALADAGTWETYVWVKDGDTPAGANTYGYAAGFNTLPIEVVGPPSVPGATAVACAYTAPATGDCWVAGDFTASAGASTGGMGSLVYQICRSVDSTGGFAGCDVNLTLAGGTSIAVAAGDLPADGFRRAYYFQARDAAGALSGWNTPRLVRVDRAGPAVAASNAADDWFSSRTATVSASDLTGGAGANSGLLEVRYSWNAALDAACTLGTVTTPGATLTAPVGDNLLYLCARDNVQRAAQWSGRYRVTAPLTVTGAVSPRQGSYAGTFTWTATASGGDPATTRYAFFRRRPGGTWIPDVGAPTWQTSGTYAWQPAAGDAGTWETYIWVKDGNTPPGANTYGYAAGVNSMPIEVVGPPTVPGATSIACAYTTADDCWVTGDFTASVTASTGGTGSLVYQICRSVDSTGGFAGCDVNLTLSGGTSIAVSGAHLPADGYRRVYYFQARDSAGGVSGWNTPRAVRVDRYAPVVSASNASDVWFSSRTATLSASDTTGGAGANSGVQAIRSSWNTPLDAGCTTGTATSSGATLTAPAGDNLLYLCARDNTGRIGQWSGRYRVAPITLTGAVSPSRGSYLGAFTWTAAATGGTPAAYSYAFFRRRPGGTWIPDVGSPNWQAGTTYSWTPALADVGTWETYVWVKDGDTPADANTYGYAAGSGTGLIEVVGPPTVPGSTTVACAYSVAASSDCWVAGDFTASVTASAGGMGTLVYGICRSIDSAGGFAGCDVNLALSGGTSIAVAGGDLPADGYRRAYYFQARDSAGALSSWNTPRYVRIDRYAPAVSATNASDDWFTSRTATLSASDTVGGAASNSGLLSVRYSWNAALDPGCATGTATSSGATINAPVGDNLLYLCARDNVSRVTQWSGRYRVQLAPAPEVATVDPLVIHQGTEAVVTVTGAHLQGASVYVATPSSDGTVSAISISLESLPTAELLGGNAEGTTLSVRIDAREPGLGGVYTLAVATPGGVTAGHFRVVGAAPVVDVYTPSQPVAGNIHILMVGGANLQGADVVPLDPAIKVLDLDNSNDSALMGLLYVDSDAPVGTYELRVERPGGEPVTLSVEVVGSVAAATLTTTQIEVPGRVQQPDVPDILLQKPVLPADSGLLDSGGGGIGGPGGIDSPATPSLITICGWASQSLRLRYTYVLLALNGLDGKPLKKEVLNLLAPGQRLVFSSLTTLATASLTFEFYFQVCNGLVFSGFYCVHGSVNFMVPQVGGYTVKFDYCNGTEGPSTHLSAQGLISKHEWSSTNTCVTVTDSDPASESGARSGEIAVDCCTPADIRLHTTGIAFNETYDAEGRVASVRQQSCVEPSGCSKTIEWQYLRDDGSNGPVMTGPVQLSTTGDQRQAQVRATFTPGGGGFQGSAWTGGEPLVSLSGESAAAATARVTLTAGPDPGAATVTSPRYVTERFECLAQVEVTVAAVEVEINRTAEHRDDMVEVRSGLDASLRRRVPARIRLPAPSPEDVTVVLTNPDGRLRFPDATDATKELTLPKNGDWVDFEISGEAKSERIDDAAIEVHLDTADGRLLGRRFATVFSFDLPSMQVTPVGFYALAGGRFAPLNNVAAVGFEASATLRPAGLDCTAPPLRDLRIGILQNARAERLVGFSNPTIACLPGNGGREVVVPLTRYLRTRVANFLDDSVAGSAPIYSTDAGALAIPLGCGSQGGTAASSDTPQMVSPLTLAIPPESPGGVPEGTVTYRLASVTMDDSFRTWAVSYDQQTRVAIPLREAAWTLNLDSASPTAQRASATADGPPANAAVTAEPFFNDEAVCNTPTDVGCRNRTTGHGPDSVTLVCH
jgi:hypothetical protein